MTTETTEAERLADRLDEMATLGDMGRKPDQKDVRRQAAAELRRLQSLVEARDAEIERLKMVSDTDKASADHWRGECERLEQWHAEMADERNALASKCDTLRAELEAIRATEDKWEGAEDWEPLAWQLCAEENGEDACSELIWEGGPIPEPWGDRWLKYEDEAKRLIKLVREYASPAAKDAGLVAALKGAATSLETISRLAGRAYYVGDDGERVETYMGHHDQVRSYATSRASVARDALSKIGGV